MSLETIKDLVTSKAARQILLTQKHSPKILFVAGAVGVVGATVLACRATLKLENTLAEHEIKDMTEMRHVDEGQLSEEDLKKARAKLKLKTAAEIAKLYAPAVGLGAVSIAALTGSHVILTKRNAGAMAAYAAVDRAYKEYRQRIANEYGEGVDRKFASGTEDLVVQEKLADGSTKKHVVQTKSNNFGGSPYAVVFDEHSKFYSREPGMNSMFLGVQQSHANDKLRANGHIFLNEVYDMLGFPRTKAGAVVGWIWRRETEDKTGDNFVSFGIFDGDLERGEAFVNGEESSVWLDFNVDGMILDLI